MEIKRNIKLETLRWCVSHDIEQIVTELETEEELERRKKLSIN